MIRMGRSSKNEEPSNETTEFQQQTTAFPNTEEIRTPTNTAVSESESMARDIKEGRLSGFVGAGTTLTGETDFNSMLRVDGCLTGSVTSENGTLIIGATGQVDAEIKVAAARVNGAVNGDITSSEKIELGRTARVVGNIKAPRLIISDGAILEGNCSMVQSNEDREQREVELQKKFATNELSSESADESSEDDYDELENTSPESTETESDDTDNDETAEAAAN